MQRPDKLLLILTVLLASGAASAADAQAIDATVEKAASVFQAGDWVEAARLYRAVTEAEPDNANAWFGLGRALYASRQADASLAAFEKALELGFQPPLTMIQIARGHAAKGEDDTAIEWLRRAAATGANIYQAISTSEEFNRLQNKAAYREIIDQVRPCNSPAFNLLDFWVGAWRVVVGEGESERQVGKNSINRILNGCAIIENWTNSAGAEGKSLFYYNEVEKIWKQVWITDNQGLKEKHLIGVLDGGAVRFQGELRQDNGALILDRTTLYPVAEQRVRQVIEQSIDGGETWRTVFDAFYVQD